MSRIFADSYYYIALLSPSDRAHQRAMEFARGYHGFYITTHWVVAEVGDALCRGSHVRQSFTAFYRSLPRTGRTKVIASIGKEALFELGVSLFENRLDKQWSLTDCISFAVMERLGITHALTGDRHFEQAGFTALLKEEPS